MAKRLMVLGVPLLLLTAVPARADLYVANSFSNNVTVSMAGPGCGSFSGILPVGPLPVGVAASPDGRRAYVTNRGDGTVSVIDTATRSVIATVPVGGSPFGPLDVAVHPDSSRAYVISNNRVAVLDTSTLTVTANVFVPGFANDVAVHPDGTRLWVTTAGGFLVLVGTASNAVLRTTTVGVNPQGIAVHPDGTRLYVAAGAGRALVLDPGSHAVIAEVPVEGVPVGVAVHPGGSRAYVVSNMNTDGNALPGKLAFLDTATNAVVLMQPLGRDGGDVAVDARHVYATNQVDATVSVFDALTGAAVDLMEVGSSPQGVATFVNPVPSPLPSSVQVTGFEVTQGIQDLAQSVTLVADRRTFVRVHVRATGFAVPNVTATLFGVGFDCTSLACVGRPLGSLVPANAVGPRINVQPSPRRGILEESFVFELPWSWTAAGRPVRLHAVLHTDPGPPSTACRMDAPSSMHTFEAPTELQIRFVRLAYRVGDTLYEASENEQQLSESFMRRIYPLSNLVTGPGLRIEDAGLGARVDRSAPECMNMPAEDRDFCAYSYMIPRLAAMSLLSDLGWGAADGAYGLFPQPAATGVCDPATPGGTSCFTRGACCVDRVSGGPSNDKDYAAHEIGHLLGRAHPVPNSGPMGCGHSASDPNFPHAFALIHPFLPFDSTTGLAGFDGGDTALGLPQTYMGSYNAHDIMGYCDPEWISDYTYRALYHALRNLRTGAALAVAGGAGAGAGATSAVQPGDWLLVSGTVTPGTPADIHALRADRVMRVPPRAPGSHSIRLVGAGGVTLADYPFTPDPLADATATEAAGPALGFAHVVPFVSGTTEIRIVDVAGGGAVLGSKPTSANAPTVGGAGLQGAPDPATGAVMLSWASSDADGDPLTFDVFYTRDGGASLQPLVLGVSGTTAEIDTTQLGGGTGQFRVMATDGVHSGFADTPPLVLPGKAPRPRIFARGEGTTLSLGQLLNLEGEGVDLQDGVIPGPGLSWSLPGRPLGTGARLSVTDLAVGTHELTLSATNSLGITATTRMLVVVRQETSPAGPTLTVGPGLVGWHVAAGTSALQTSELHVGNSGSGELTFTAESTAPWLSLSAGGGTAPATLTLTADPTGLANGVTAEASVSVSATGLTGQAFTVPVTLSVGNTFMAGKPAETPDQCPADPDKTAPGACGCGIPDSQEGQACSTGSEGVCEVGITVCGGGTSSCVPTTSPAPEICDGLDNNCDGTPDEGNPGGDGSCATGLPGVCSAGIQICTGGGLFCQQTTSPDPEVCGNGIDEDCDGADLACPPPPPPGDGCTAAPLLDAFARADGRLGADWRGLTDPTFYRIRTERLDVQAGGPVFWNRNSFGPNQAASVTLSTVAPRSPSQGLLLKVQDGSVPGAGAIAVVYDAAARAVRVSTVRLGVAWTPYGQAAVRFDDGDELGACATDQGQVRVFKNDVLVQSVTLSAADQRFFNPRGGKVGLWSVLASHGFFDDFAGATVTP